MSDNQENLITQFKDVTSADDHRARFFLESSAWELDLAIYRFFENDGEENVGNRAPEPVPEPVNVSDSDPELLIDDGDEDVPMRAQKKEKTKKNTSTKFATLSSLQQDSSSDEEEGQAFYAGGSERSGQQIIGPSKKKKEDIVTNMFKSVKKHGAMVLEPNDNPSSSTSFGGTGYRLGATPDETTVVNTSKASKKGDAEVDKVVLRLWRNGFSLDNGDLRLYTDPANAMFLNSVRAGEIPPELQRGPEILLVMEDHRHEDFSKTKEPAKPFHGKGNLLGSPAPTTIGSTSPQAASPLDQEANQNMAQASLNINESEPITKIQFRLADGSRISGRFNLTHTVANLREYIITAAPAYQLQTFILQTTFPNRELSESALTIAEAGLQNAVVTQRLK